MNNNYYETVNKRRTIKGVIALLIAAVILAVAFVGAKILVDYNEVKEIGANFVSAYFTDIVMKVITICVVFVVAVIFSGLKSNG